jgi:hypothetical protein
MPVLILPLVPLLGAGPDASVPPDLQHAIRERREALQSADAARWERTTSPDFTLVNTQGKVQTRAERSAAIKKQRPLTSTTEQEQVRVYGNTAVQQALQGGVWVLQVWVKRPEGWQVVVTQLTTAAP